MTRSNRLILGVSMVGFLALGGCNASAAAPTALPPQAPLPPRSTYNVDQLKGRLDAWLTTHADRQGQTRAHDILPGESFCATAVRFNEESAARFSNNPSQWSQIRLDLNRDGTDDEKWLLQNGRTYKREVLDINGHSVIYTQHFNN